MYPRLLSFLLATAIAGLSASAQNPYLPLWEHVPDGEPHVFADPDNPGRQRVYVIGSHDTYVTAYCGNDVRMWSAPVEDLTQWRDEGPIFTLWTGGQWDTMYAPDIAEVTDPATGQRTYWLYPHSRGWRRVGTVCRSDRPSGPFTPVNLTADSSQCLDGSPIDFDPAVCIEPVTNRRDPDFARGYRAYAYWGFLGSSACELDPQTMYSVRPGTKVHTPFIPAGTRQGQLNTDEGTKTTYPDILPGEQPNDFRFFEASSIRRVGNKYVFIFSGFGGEEYGMSPSNSTLRYAYADTPLGPWRSGGVLVDSRGIVPDAEGQHLTETNFGHNTHGSIEQVGDQWYVFYHRPPRGYGFARQGMAAPILVEWDKKPVAKGGAVRITGYDPYARDGRWTARAADGKEYLGAEVTSEGFNIFGLPPYACYSAGLACYFAGPGHNGWLQDNYDVWHDGMDLTGIGNGGTVGFKYFGFGGLQVAQKGVPAFAATQKGDATRLCLRLTPRGKACTIRVLIDGPAANAASGGRELAVIELPASAQQVATTVEAPVPQVEGLQGKHAIYLAISGEDNVSLLDLHAIGFARQGQEWQVPTVPTVELRADGQRLNIPATPIPATNANGYTELCRYQLYAPLRDNSVIEATSSDPAVSFRVGAVADGRATVTATYRGKTKHYLIN
ncbi:MAG: hypothetical protein IJS59_02955 [Bacteroidaceae bacterium]|nr:hypothetical protein [Bacteroidaceae bacterium]